MLLQPNSIGFLEPGQDFIIQLVNGFDQEMVDVISGRNGFIFCEPRRFKSSRQYHVSLQFISAEFVHGGKDHSGLEPDSGLGRSKQHWTQPEHQLFKCAIQGFCFLSFAHQKVFDGIFSARMLLIPVRELS
jgi:hypothetical protein